MNIEKMQSIQESIINFLKITGNTRIRNETVELLSTNQRNIINKVNEHFNDLIQNLNNIKDVVKLLTYLYTCVSNDETDHEFNARLKAAHCVLLQTFYALEDYSTKLTEIYNTAENTLNKSISPQKALLPESNRQKKIIEQWRTQQRNQTIIVRALKNANPDISVQTLATELKIAIERAQTTRSIEPALLAQASLFFENLTSIPNIPTEYISCIQQEFLEYLFTEEPDQETARAEIDRNFQHLTAESTLDGWKQLASNLKNHAIANQTAKNFKKYMAAYRALEDIIQNPPVVETQPLANKKRKGFFNFLSSKKTKLDTAETDQSNNDDKFLHWQDTIRATITKYETETNITITNTSSTLYSQKIASGIDERSARKKYRIAK